MRKILIGCALALAVAPLSRGAMADGMTRIVVSASVQAEIDAYVQESLVVSHFWALAIAKDGSRVASASCPLVANPADGGPCSDAQGLMQDLASREAVRLCGGADECVLLYEGYQKTAVIEIVAP